MNPISSKSSSPCPSPRRAARQPHCCLAIVVVTSLVFFHGSPSRLLAVEPPASATRDVKNDRDTQDDLAAKSALLQSPRWRRAIFELGEWLSTQKIYPPKEVQRIKADFNAKVMKMSSHELEYLLDDLEAKFKVMDTPEAQEARAWVGQYLSAMSNHRRAEAIKDVPNVVDMTAGQLSQEIEKIERTRQALKDRQAAFDEGRQLLVTEAEANRKATADASVAATAKMNSGPSYSPYRSNGGGSAGGSPPFANAHVGSGMSIGVGPMGAYVGFSLGNF